MVNDKLKEFFKLVIFIPFIFCSCKKNSDDQIPNVLVDINISPTQPGFTNLNIIGGWVYITGGVKGIIVYRKSFEEFAAYDRDCTYQPAIDNERVQVDSTNLCAIDLNCGSKFLLLDGSVINGPAARSLKSYQTEFNGTYIHIYNY